MARQLQPCGTSAAYRRHHRRGQQPCDACREAENARNRKPGGVPRPIAQHGSSGKYRAGCRCETCATAHRERMRAWREAVAGLAETVPELVPHGVGGYRNYGCRCVTCCTAHRTSERERYWRRKAEAAAP